MRFFFIISLLLAFTVNVKSQCPLNSPEVIFMADGGGSTYSWNAGLYNLGQVGGIGNITSISFRLDNPWSPSETYNNQYIYMRHTNITDYNGNQSYPGTAGFTLVWSGTFNINSNGFYNITLSTPFYYNGTEILEVLIENKSNHSPYVELWFDRTDASSTVYNGKLGAGYSWSGAISNNTKRQFNLAIGFNTNNTVSCTSFESTLPIKLKSFKAKNEKNNINISWVTASEINNDFFTIEHSLDGINFTKIERVKGAGNSNKQLNYSVIDNNPKNGINYYRLKQTDFDGTYTYSKIQAVKFEESENNDIYIYPNPVIGEILNIETKNENSTINLYNCIGEKMKITITNSLNKHIIDVSELPKGIYFVETIVSGNSIYNKVLIK